VSGNECNSIMDLAQKDLCRCHCDVHISTSFETSQFTIKVSFFYLFQILCFMHLEAFEAPLLRPNCTCGVLMVNRVQVKAV